MNYLKLIALILPTFLLLGCDRLLGNNYEFSKDGNGQSYRLDKRTGEMMIINGDHFERVKSEEESRVEQLKIKEEKEKEKQEIAEKKKTEENQIFLLGLKKTWGTVTLSKYGDMNIKLVTSWQNGKVYYKLTASGGELDKLNTQRDNYYVRPQFIINFIDYKGFKIESIIVPLKSMTRTIGPNSTTLGFEISESAFMRQEIYQNISEWSLSWVDL
jgi:hypothetical protein